MKRFLTGPGLPALMLAAPARRRGGVALRSPAVRWLQPITWRADAVASLASLGTGIAYVLNYRLIADEGPYRRIDHQLPLASGGGSRGVLVLAEPA
jgi:hypothetical protein